MSVICRRAFLVEASALLALSTVCRSQPADRLRRIGFMSLETAESEGGQEALKLFPEALRQRGYVEGENLLIDWRWANGRLPILPELAADLVRNKAEVIVARNNAPIQAAMKVTPTIPIVMLNGNFPVEDGLVKSLARPGGNVTGTSYWPSAETFGKHLQLLKELAPRTSRVAVLWIPNNSTTDLNQAIQTVLGRAASQLGMTIHYFDVRQPDDIPGALAAIASSKINAMFYRGEAMMRTRSSDIMAFLRDQRMASIAAIPTFAEAGGLAHYSLSGRSFFDRTAYYVDRILRGARPSDLPVEEPTNYEFVVNARTARSIGLTIPQKLLLRADRVIE
jgi:putative tryptophan/tyrosine transport system substrate-binding protein